MASISRSSGSSRSCSSIRSAVMSMSMSGLLVLGSEIDLVDPLHLDLDAPAPHGREGHAHLVALDVEDDVVAVDVRDTADDGLALGAFDPHEARARTTEVTLLGEGS